MILVTHRISLFANGVWPVLLYILGFPCDSIGKESAWNEGDRGSIPGLGRSPGEGKSYPLQHSGLENSTVCIVHGVPKSQTQLSDFHFNFSIHIGAKGQLKDLKLWKLYSFTLGESTLPSVTK